MKISVAMATYNGEKYIREQLETILNQTVPVDEIIVSDDGSKDSTLDIVRSLGDSRIKIITGNPRPGYCGNFEYALKHTTGDIIFLADQDDVWMPERVEHNLRIFQDFPNIELVITNGTLIDKDGNHLDGQFNHIIIEHESLMLKQTDYLAKSVYTWLAGGMTMAIRRVFLCTILPFPDSETAHDHWISFCAIRNNSAYYLDLPLIKYRIHDTNTSLRGSRPLKERIRRLVIASYNRPFDFYNMSCAMLRKLNPTDPCHTDAISKAQSRRDYHLVQIDAIRKGGLTGSATLVKHYLTNGLYRSNGPKYFLAQISLTLFGRNYIKKNNRKATM